MCLLHYEIYEMCLLHQGALLVSCLENRRVPGGSNGHNPESDFLSCCTRAPRVDDVV